MAHDCQQWIRRTDTYIFRKGFSLGQNPIPIHVAEERSQTYLQARWRPSQPLRLQGISLQSVVMKMFCSILNARPGGKSIAGQRT